MTSVPLIPDNAPFTMEQRAWLNGFLAGMLSRGTGSAVAASSLPSESRKSLLIAFGSQSGNAESLAKRLAKEANAKGFAAQAAGLDSLKAADLLQKQNLLLITSTWGEGDMPDNAASFWESLNQNGSSPALTGLKFSVLALGDKNYGETFCLAGRKMDERLAALGATRVHPRMDCDVDFDEPARMWSAGAFEALLNGSAVTPTNGQEVTESRIAVETKAAPGTKGNPFPAPLIANLKLNSADSAKDTRHIAFSLAGSGVVYETGDALGVVVQNDPAVIDAIIAARKLDSSERVILPDGGQAPLREALIKHYEVRAMLGKTFDASQTAAEFVDGLKKLQPRLYSIASSLKAHPDEVHLCIGAVRYEVNGFKHQGVASTFLADRLAIGETTGVFVHSAKHFRLPASGETPIIMVGPGTGIAPFRAFLEERQATGAVGKNWLFFGDQKSQCDFLYRDLITAWHQDGFLSRLDLAFSRDQAEKIYVQNRMLERAAELWKWLEEGAHFYVCGDASRMAKDVDAALHQIIREQGGRSADDAAAFVSEMKKSKRYARDVY